MEKINSVTSYFNQNQKATMLYRKMQLKRGLMPDRLKTLKHDIPTRWHSHLASLSSYLGCYDEIIAAADQLGVPSSRIPRLSSEERNTIAEFITVMNEVRLFARQLEADRKVTMPRAPRIVREQYKTLLIMCGDLSNNDRGFYRVQEEESGLLLQGEEDIAQSHLSIASIASAEQERNAARKIRLLKTHAKKISRELSEAIHTRLGHIWKQMSSTAEM